MIEHIRACVAHEINQVDALIVRQLESDVDMVENIGHYIVSAGGKRLRPLLALLSAKLLGTTQDSHIRFAAVVEFIHTATLLHDDVVDLSSLRRGRPTANEQFGNAPSVLVGDFLYTRAFQLMVTLNNMPLLQHMADTTNTIAEGEVLQLTRAGTANPSVEQYIDVITRKTAVLFGAACYGAALLQQASEQDAQRLHAFGVALGIAFQMTDDVLDYAGNPEETGKNVGDDLREGKATLPLIHTLLEGAPEDQECVRSALVNKSAAELTAVMRAVQRSDGINATRRIAQRYIDEALEQLAAFPDSEAKTSLLGIAQIAVERNS